MREWERERREREREREKERERERERELYITRLKLYYVTTHKTKAFPGAGAEQRCMGTIVEK